MKRRIRFLAGILSLLALTFSFAEAVRASTCAPVTTMAGDVMTISSGNVSGPDCHVFGEARHGEPDREEGERYCPFGSAMTAQSCTGAASMPAHSSALLAPSFEEAAAGFALEARRDLLLESTLFRPPRA